MRLPKKYLRGHMTFTLDAQRKKKKEKEREKRERKKENLKKTPANNPKSDIILLHINLTMAFRSKSLKRMLHKLTGLIVHARP
jgi:hypothetical protein